MDLTRILQQLYAEKERLQKAIAILEQMMQENPESPAADKRGRKSMTKHWSKKEEPEAPEKPANAKSTSDQPDHKP